MAEFIASIHYLVFFLSFSHSLFLNNQVKIKDQVFESFNKCQLSFSLNNKHQNVITTKNIAIIKRDANYTIWDYGRKHLFCTVHILLFPDNSGLQMFSSLIIQLWRSIFILDIPEPDICLILT